MTGHKNHTHLDSIYYREKYRLQCEMNTEAAGAVLQIEGIGTRAAADLDPSDFGKFENQDGGTILFIWRGKSALRFGFRPGAKVGKGLELTVERLFLEGAA